MAIPSLVQPTRRKKIRFSVLPNAGPGRSALRGAARTAPRIRTMTLPGRPDPLVPLRIHADREARELQIGWSDGHETTYGSSPSGTSPPAAARPRSSSVLNSAPNKIAMLEIHSQTRKMITPAMLP